MWRVSTTHENISKANDHAQPVPHCAQNLVYLQILGRAGITDGKRKRARAGDFDVGPDDSNLRNVAKPKKQRVRKVVDPGAPDLAESDVDDAAAGWDADTDDGVADASVDDEIPEDEGAEDDVARAEDDGAEADAEIAAMDDSAAGDRGSDDSSSNSSDDSSADSDSGERGSGSSDSDEPDAEQPDFMDRHSCDHGRLNDLMVTVECCFDFMLII